MSSPRFHRVRFNPANPTSHSPSTTSSSTSALLPPSSLDSPVSKRSWFSSIFSRRPSLDLFNKASKKKASSALPPALSAGGSRSAITGIYSSKTTLAIADEVRRALKSAGIRYTVTKGNSNGASLFECEVGGEEEKETETQNRLGLRFLTRRKSTTAIDPHISMLPTHTVDARFAAGRRASVGNAVVGALSRTAPVDSAHIPVVESSGSTSPKKRAGGIPMPPAPRHAVLAKARSKSPPSDEEQAARGTQSAGSTPRNGVATPAGLAAPLPPAVPQHARHASMRAAPPAGAPSIPGSRRRSNSNEEGAEGDGAVVEAAAVAPCPVVKLIVEITSHHSNDLRCVRFLHIAGDEQLYRQVQTDIQQRLTLNAAQ